MLLGLVAVSGLFLLEKQWGGVVVQKVLEQVNQQLRIPIKTSGVDFTFFADFPRASIRLRDVRIATLRKGQTDVPEGEELLQAQSLLLVLNPFDLLREEYRVVALHVAKGALRLQEHKDGSNNYTLELPPPSDTVPKGATSWAIEGFELEDMRTSYLDARSDLKLHLRLDELKANGRYQGQVLGLRLKGEGTLEEIAHAGKPYAKGEELALDVELRNDSLKLESPRSTLEINGNKLVGVWSLSHEKGDLHAHMDAPGLELGEMLKRARQQGYKLPEGLELDGQLAAGVDIHGIARKGQRLAITVTAQSKGALDLSYKGEDYRITRLVGTFTNGERASAQSSRLELQECHIARGNSHADLMLRLTNLKQPAIYGRIDLSAQDNEFPLGALAKYVPHYDEIVAKGEGMASLQSMDHIGEELLRRMKTKMTVSFSGLTVIPGGGQRLDSLAGAATFKDRDLIKGSIRAKWGEADIDVGVNAKRFWSLATGKGKTDWIVNTTIKGWSIPDYIVPDWGEEKAENQHNTDERGTESDEGAEQKAEPQRTFWDYVGSMQGKLALNKCLYRGGVVDSLQASFSGNGEQVLVDIAQGRLFDGHIRGKLGFQSLGTDRQLLRANLYPQSIDIQRIFRQFANFGQQTIKAENINGRLSGEITVYAPFRAGELLTKELRLQTKVNIYKGALRDLKGLEQLSRFIEMKELQNIRFSTLSNTISVENGELRIPQMDVRSSALSLSLSGRQHFDSRYEYRLQLKLGDVLFNRWKQRRDGAEQKSLENRKSGGGSLFLRIEGDSTRMNVHYDRDALKQQIAKRFAREGQELKTIFQEEFGGKAKKQAPEEEKGRARVIWDEADDKGNAGETRPRQSPDDDRPNRRKKPSVIWDE